MSRFNKIVSNKATNLAGGQSFKMNARTELTHAVLTTFFDNKFYEDSSDRQSRIKKLVKECDPVFVAKLAVIARDEFNLRSVSHFLIAELSKNYTGEYLRKAIIKSVIRVDDITEIVALLKCKLPKQVKRGLRRSLYKFNRYQLAKYKSNRKSVKLVDLFNLLHPNPTFANDEQKQAWSDLIKGELKSFDTWETDIKKLPALVLENKIGYMALLRNLNNLIKQNVDDNVINAAVSTLTNPEKVKKSRQLPFRFLTAYSNVSGNRKLRDAISIAMDIAVDNVPKFEGKTLIAVDCSGSMGGGSIQKAAIFGATLNKSNLDADLILYDTQITECEISSRLPVIDAAQKIIDSATGGGTMTSLVFEYASTKKYKYDRIIIISDNESWMDYSIQLSYTKYRKVYDCDPFVYAIDIEGYGTKDITGNKVTHLTGWSDRLLDFIEAVEKGGDLIKYIDNYEL